MSAEDTIARYTDESLLGAAGQLSQNERAGWADSWESKRLRELLREIRRRGLDRPKKEGEAK